MDRFLFTDILDQTLVPFIQEKFPIGHRFMQDNDPKHTSNFARDFIVDHRINWWKTPAESPDLKNLWHELKEFSRREVKPTTKQELIDGIGRFWRTVSDALIILRRLCHVLLNLKVLQLAIHIHAHSPYTFYMYCTCTFTAFNFFLKPYYNHVHVYK